MAEKRYYAHDLQLRLGSTPSPAGLTGTKSYACSLCKRTFVNLQALGGHQTAHRKEMEELRKSYDVAEGAQRNCEEQVASGSNAKASDDMSIDLELSLRPGGVDLNLKL